MELNDSVSSAELFGPTVTVGTMKDEQERDVDTDYQCWRDYYQVATLGQECWHFLTGLSLANLRPPGPALGSYWAGLGMWQGAHLVRLVMSAEIITVINIEIFWRLHCLPSAWHQVNINWNSVSAPSLWSDEDLLQVAKSAGAEINLKFVSTPHSVPIKVWQYYRQTHHLVILRRKIKPNHDLELLSVLSYRSEISSLWESKKSILMELPSPQWMVLLVYKDMSSVTEPGSSQGSPPWELRCQLYSPPFVFGSLLSLRSKHGNISANPRGLTGWERDLLGKEALMNITWAWSVPFIVWGSHWHPGYELLYQVSTISHQRQKPMKARSGWRPTFISPHLSSDWSRARSNYMNNRQRGINQRRHLEIIRDQRMINYHGAELAGVLCLRWRLWCQIFVVRHVRLSQTESDCVRLSVWVTPAWPY